MHNAAFEALGMAWRYELLPVSPGDLLEAVLALPARGFRGVNVTIPHKEAVMPALDEISDAAGHIGAVNTVIVEPDGRLLGDNTDWIGFLHPLDARGFDLAGRRALLLGAGGSARAVVYALARRGIGHLTIVNRSLERGRQLAAHARSLGIDCRFHHSQFPVSGSQPAPALVINTTPVGMWPHVDASPWPPDLALPAGALIYDLVYRPEQTRLLRQAAAAGCQTQGGLEMLVVQGAVSFELWTGQVPPLEPMMSAARQALESPS